MYHFFVEPEMIQRDYIFITGNDVNHIKNVLRLEEADQLILCDMKGKDYRCSIHSLTNEEIRCKIHSIELSKAELPIDIHLYQGTPKQDKLELIIQKTVELGVHDITPVQMQRSIAKYDQKKLTKKLSRWRNISLSAAKQSKRGVIPKVHSLIKFQELLKELKDYDRVLVPYENELGMKETRRIIRDIEAGESIAIVIGPEGGFSEGEIKDLRALGGKTITLGNRILRTETAGMATIAMLGYEIEEA